MPCRNKSVCIQDFRPAEAFSHCFQKKNSLHDQKQWPWYLKFQPHLSIKGLAVATQLNLSKLISNKTPLFAPLPSSFKILKLLSNILRDVLLDMMLNPDTEKHLHMLRS
ncbi:hypothetical protein OTU49_014501 [Cherax quadricarinatus]|uniref:Uncharacterized protein n=1 Tax=Cherax quadricarinatus TaxID=27406 RepID=A0AAW0VNV4_CHEQU